MIETKVKNEMMTFMYEGLILDVELNQTFLEDIKLIVLNAEGLYIETFSSKRPISLFGINYRFTSLNEANERVAILDWTERSALMYLQEKYNTDQSVFRFNKLKEG